MRPEAMQLVSLAAAVSQRRLLARAVSLLLLILAIGLIALFALLLGRRYRRHALSGLHQRQRAADPQIASDAWRESARRLDDEP